MQTFNSTTQLMAQKGTPTARAILLGYYTPGDGGGGTFYWDNTSTATANNGTIFAVTGVVTGRWLRDYQNRTVDVKWFGAKNTGVVGDAAANMTAFNSALTAVTSIVEAPFYTANGTILVPGGIYYLTGTWTLNTTVKIIGGAGVGFLQETVLRFPANTTGIFITAPHVPAPIVTAGFGTYIEGITVFCYLASTDKTKHGFDSRGLCVLKNCTATYFPGNGFNLVSDAGDLESPLFGNCAFSLLERCRAQTCENGFYFAGGDSNVITILDCDATQNRRWGFFDNAFLGNTFIGCHVADNTYSPDNKSQVTNNGSKYICVQNNTNIEPGVTVGWQTYWVDVGNPFGTYFTPWNNAENYLSGGGYSSYPGENANTTFLGCYSEGGQPSTFGLRTMVMGGDMGAVLFPESFGNMLFEAVGSKYSFRAPVQYARTGIDFTVIMGNEGLGVYPAEALSPYGLNLIYNNAGKIFREDYANASFPTRYVTTHQTVGSDYGLGAGVLDSTKWGLPVFPRGMFLRDLNGGQRYLGFAQSIPVAGTYAQGDFLLKKVTGAGDTVLGFRCTVAGTPGTWETLNITIS